MKNQIILFLGILLLLGLFIVPNKLMHYYKNKKGSSSKSTHTHTEHHTRVHKNGVINQAGTLKVDPDNPVNVDLRIDDSNCRGLLGRSSANIRIYNKGIYSSAYDRMRLHIVAFDKYGHYLGERVEVIRGQVCKGETIKQNLEISRNTDEIYCSLVNARPAVCAKRRIAEGYGHSHKGHGKGKANSKSRIVHHNAGHPYAESELSKEERELRYIRAQEEKARAEAERARRIKREQEEMERRLRREEDEMARRIQREQDLIDDKIARERERTNKKIDRERRRSRGRIDRLNEGEVVHSHDYGYKEERTGLFGSLFGRNKEKRRSHGYYHGKNAQDEGILCPYCSEYLE